MNDPIAVTGVGALFPGSESPNGFWRTIVSAKDCLREVPSTHWLLSDYYDPDPSRSGKTYARRGAFLEGVPFEPLEHGIPPNVVPSTDTAQLLALIVAERVQASSGGKIFEHIDRDRIGVILGVASATELVSTMAGSLQRPVLARALREEGFPADEIERICTRVDRSYVDWTESTFPGLLGNVVAGRVANRFDLGGTNCVVDAACASSLGAVRMAMQELWSGSADMVITGGVDAINDIFMYMCFSKTMAMSRTGDCRPFASDADGTMLGEGVGMFALRRLADAERDGDAIYAVLRGIGSSSDGRAKSIYAPRPAGQAKALRRAYESAGYSPASVELLEAHGTGTPAGDAAEVEALNDVFGSTEGAAPQTIALGSIKSQIGHTKSAAGAASLYKAVMALHHKVLPATIKVREPNPALGLRESPFYLNTELRPWVRGNDHARRAGVSAFGFGGSNFHLTVEEYTGAGPRPPRIRTLASELFLVSGADEREALGKARELADAAARPDGFERAARESQRSFDASSEVRIAFVAANAAEVADKARRAGPGVPDVAFGKGPVLQGGVAFLFPGQGSQYIGMGAALAMGFSEAIGVWDRAASLAPALPSRVFPPPVFEAAERERQTAELMATEVAQPALGVTEWMYLSLLEAAGLKPDFCAGHSFGEVSALFAASVLSPEDFLAVAAERGRLMAAAAAEHSGAMVAVAAAASEVEPLLPEGVTLANLNSPRQVVVAGPRLLTDQAAATLSAKGFTVQALRVATAFHSPVVSSAAEPFTEFLSGIRWNTGRVPVFSNSTAAAYPGDAAEAKALLGGQLARPVRFVEQIEALYAAGARFFAEVGPGNTLTSLAGACLEGREHIAVAMDSKGKDAVTGFWMGLAKLAAAGVPFDTDFAWRDYQIVAETPRPSPLAMSVSGTNFGKKYPRPEEPVVPRVRPTAVIPGSPPVQKAPSDERAAAVRKIHEQMAESHAAMQRALSESHLAYLRATEAAFGHLGNGVGATAMVAPAAPTVLAAPQAPVVQPAPAIRRPAEPVAKPAKDLAELVMEVVAAKTGYPRDVLQLDMDLEADLGIDSIKRVQILAAVCEARPDLPQADAKNMATLRTLGAILDFLGGEASEVPSPAFPQTASAPPAAEPSGDLRSLVMGVVAEKTGYPRDVLQPEMDLEADLGIDSIKRVQILAAVCEARPDLPQADAKNMATLRTLGAILDFLGAAESKTPAPTPVSSGDLLGLVMEVVAAKTGYPRDVLRPEMDLEADLGIDSIKRVQILAAVREARPDLPDVDAKQMGTLRTIGAILAHLEQDPSRRETPPPEPPKNDSAQLPVWLSKNGLARLGLREVTAAGGEAQRELKSGSRVEVIGDSTVLREAVIDGLRNGGLKISLNAVDPAESNGIVFVASSSAENGALPVQARLAFEAARRARRGLFVTVAETSSPLRRGLAALAKTVALENPEVIAKAISVDPGEAGRVAEEILNGRSAGEIILRHGGRAMLKEVSLPIARTFDSALLQGKPVIVVSGGARGVTASCLKGLAEVAPMRFALLGRSALKLDNELASAGSEAELKSALVAAARKRGETIVPKEIAALARELISSREILKTLEQLRELGSEAMYYSCDVRDSAAVAEALNQVRAQWGSINGLIHGAGVVADKSIADKSAEQFERVFATKVLGLRNLLDAVREDKLRLLLLFSSVAGRYGNAGQVDYAMANATIGQMALDEAVRRGNGCLVRSLSWGPWDGGMVTPDLRAHFEQRGVPVIPIAQGVAAFVQELGHWSDDPADLDVVLAVQPAGERLAGLR